jgi:hypothetical protein
VGSVGEGVRDPRGDKLMLYCTECGKEVKESELIACVEEIPDFQYGKPAVQKHEYQGSPCCGESVEEEE